MHRIIYTVKSERVEEHERLVHAVFDELRQRKPADIRYASYRATDGLTYMHLVMKEGNPPLPHYSAFRAFVEGIADRCSVAPRRETFERLDAYGLPDD